MKPIGWWLRHVHELLESSMLQALEPESLTRRHWQVLNTIALGARTSADVDTAMSPFVAVEGSTAPKISDLRERGWVTEGDDFTLTDEGRAAHARVEEGVQAFRSAVRRDISDDDYVTTVKTLEQCAANLEALTTA